MDTSVINKTIYLLFIILFFSINLNGTWGTAIYFILILSIFFLSTIQTGTLNVFSSNSFFRFFLGFVIICLLSNLWATNRELSWEASSSLMRMWFAFGLLYAPLKRISANSLFGIITWGSTLFFIYVIYHIGINQIILMSHLQERLGTEYYNSNALGLLGAAVSVICFSSLLHKGLSWNIIAGVLGGIVVIITASRQAFIVLLLGLFLQSFFKLKKKSIPSLLFKSCILLALFATITIIIFKLPIFSLPLERFLELGNIFSKTEDLSHSDWERMVMIEEGWKQFFKTPFLGIGIDNGRIIAYSIVDHYFYLHNNYIELLVDVGICGFISFYLIYGYLGYRIYHLRHYWDENIKLVITLCLMFLIADWGIVSYYKKDILIVLMICYIIIENASLSIYPNVLRHISYMNRIKKLKL